MYSQSDFSPDARGHKIVHDMKHFGIRCNGIARSVDSSVPDRYLIELRRQIAFLMVELEKHERRIDGILAGKNSGSGRYE